MRGLLDNSPPLPPPFTTDISSSNWLLTANEGMYNSERLLDDNDDFKDDWAWDDIYDVSAFAYDAVASVG